MNHLLNLTRPLIVLDTETTGTDTTKDRIIELAMLKIVPGAEDETRTRRFNPGIPIPAKATEVHGIHDEDVADLPKFSQYAKGILEYIKGCDILGFNSNRFDCPLLYAEFVRAGLIWDYSGVNFIDAGNIFKIMQPRTLEAAVKYYLQHEHEGAHGAQSDTLATLQVFSRMSELHKEELPRTIPGLATFSNFDKPMLDLSGKFTTNDQMEIIFNFGPHFEKVATSEPGFLKWMLSKDFAPDTKAICQQLLKLL
jgi:DNA polymerase-3 subunit epsilon